VGGKSYRHILGMVFRGNNGKRTLRWSVLDYREPRRTLGPSIALLGTVQENAGYGNDKDHFTPFGGTSGDWNLNYFESYGEGFATAITTQIGFSERTAGGGVFSEKGRGKGARGNVEVSPSTHIGDILEGTKAYVELLKNRRGIYIPHSCPKSHLKSLPWDAQNQPLRMGQRVDRGWEKCVHYRQISL